MTLKELFDKRRIAEESARALMQKTDRTADDVVQANKLLDQAAQFESEFETQKRLDEIDAKNAEVTAEEKKNNPEAESPEQAKMTRLENLRYYLLTGRTRQGDKAARSLDPEERAAVTAQTVTTTGGGYAVPTETKKRITEALLAYGGMYANSTIIPTSGGNPINWPTNNDTANKCQLLGINTDVDTLTQAALTFGTFTLSAFKYTSGSIKVPIELLQDSIIDMEAFVVKQLSTRMSRGMNTEWTTGAGTTRCEGVVTGATYADGGGMGNDSVSRTNILNLIHSVDPAYRTNGKLMMNDSTLKSIKLLSIGTSDDRPLWQAGMAFGEPATIEGYPYIINQDVASMASGAKFMLFGDFSNFYIREVAEWRILRLGELYAMVDQVAFVVFARYDSKLDDAGTHPVKYIQNASTTT